MAQQRRTGSSNSRNGTGDLSAGEAVGRAREQFEALLGRPAEAISSCAAVDKGWTVTVEVVELERIPPTTSLLGSYEVQLDSKGELVGYRRLRRYARNQADRVKDDDE